MDSRDIIKERKKGGWYEVNQVGSHKQFKHAEKQRPPDRPASEARHSDKNAKKASSNRPGLS
jgi:hypothetical protein